MTCLSRIYLALSLALLGQVRLFLTISTPETFATTLRACAAVAREFTLPPSDTVPWSDSTWIVYFLVT